MRLVIDRNQLLDGHLSVFLGGGKTTVPEHFLDGAQVSDDTSIGANRLTVAVAEPLL